AQAYLDQHAIGNIEFSGGTYQVQVKDLDTGEDAWSFLQFDTRGKLKDRFCSCEGSEDVSACAHLAASYLRIFSGHDRPVHERFHRSLWNLLCHLSWDSIGDDPKSMTQKTLGVYSHKTQFFAK